MGKGKKVAGFLHKKMDYLGDLIGYVTPRKDGDIVDRLNYCYTTIALVVATTFLLGWEFMGDPIACWFPAFYKGGWEEYALDYCYVQNTYFFEITDNARHDTRLEAAAGINHIPSNYTDRMERVLPYYQWVTFFFAFQAMSFFLPICIWRGLCDQYGFAVNTILETASSSSNLDPDERKQALTKVGRFMHVGLQRETQTVNRKIVAEFRARSVAILYIAVKFLYLFNSIVQFFLLGAFIDYSWYYGAKVLYEMSQGMEWDETGHFPRVTMCDFEVRVLGNLHRHTVQCVLMINTFSEKFFILFWFVFLALIVLNTISLIDWIYRLSQKGRPYVYELLQHTGADPETPRDYVDSNVLDSFVEEMLQLDGLFLIQMIESNAGDIVSAELVKDMWLDFCEKYPHQLRPSFPKTPMETFSSGSSSSGSRSAPMLPPAPHELSPPPRYKHSHEEEQSPLLPTAKFPISETGV